MGHNGSRHQSLQACWEEERLGTLARFQFGQPYLTQFPLGVVVDSWL